MKIDRFVKVMLVLIVMLLALNCFNNFSNSSDSRGNTKISGRNSSTPIFERTVEAAPIQYKAVFVGITNYMSDANSVQRSLDQMSAEGWEYVGSVSMVLIFKK